MSVGFMILLRDSSLHHTFMQGSGLPLIMFRIGSSSFILCYTVFFLSLRLTHVQHLIPAKTFVEPDSSCSVRFLSGRHSSCKTFQF